MQIFPLWNSCFCTTLFWFHWKCSVAVLYQYLKKCYKFKMLCTYLKCNPCRRHFIFRQVTMFLRFQPFCSYTHTQKCLRWKGIIKTDRNSQLFLFFNPQPVYLLREKIPSKYCCDRYDICQISFSTPTKRKTTIRSTPINQLIFLPHGCCFFCPNYWLTY